MFKPSVVVNLSICGGELGRNFCHEMVSDTDYKRVIDRHVIRIVELIGVNHRPQY